MTPERLLDIKVYSHFSALAHRRSVEYRDMATAPFTSARDRRVLLADAVHSQRKAAEEFSAVLEFRGLEL